MSTAAFERAAGPRARRPAHWWWERGILVGGLLIATLLAWGQLVHVQAHTHAGASFPLLLLLWSLMIVAMMLPAASPMIVTFTAVSGRDGGSVVLRTALFIAAYLGVWSVVSPAARSRRPGSTRSPHAHTRACCPASCSSPARCSGRAPGS